MLTQIHIKDLVIVTELTLDFGPGMTVLTGETGAGKSILIDGLGLALGDKADSGMIRQGCQRAEVSASFEVAGNAGVRDWLAEHDLEDDEGELILRRVLSASGRSKASVNGSPVSRQMLAELGGLLVDIHGQHAHQSLVKPNAQRQLLDAFAQHDGLLAQAAEAHAGFKQAQDRLSELRKAAADRASRLEFLDYQLEELDAIDLGDDELDELDAEQRRLNHSEKLQSETGALAALLFDDESSVQVQLARAATRLEPLSEWDKSLAEGLEQLASAQIQVEEVAATLRDYAERVELDPARLQEVDDRLTVIHDLARKHRTTPEALPEFIRTRQTERDQLRHADEALAELEAEVERLRGQLTEACAQLTASRQQAANKLSDDITASMQGLAMQGGQFAVQLSPVEPDKISASGADRIDLMVAANPGQSLAPLAKVASGGELSRISLAIQVATAGCSEVPTLIFDEVDVGIGGAVAEIVGQLLRRLGGERQVMCVTHLPQVAAQGHGHCRVQKHSDGVSTETSITVLNEQARVEELARMLGGVDITEQTLAHAREMLVAVE